MGTLTGTLTLAAALSASVEPRHKHDCDKCTFLGHVDCDGIQPRDAYVCVEHEGDTLILRYGDIPEQNSSYPAGLAHNWADKCLSPEARLICMAYDAWVAAGRPS